MNALPPHLKNKFQGLKSVSPDNSWKAETKNRLIHELRIPSGRQLKSHLAIRQVFSFYLNNLFKAKAWRSLGGATVLVALIMGPGVATVSAARGSLPGDTLYGVKRGIEKAQVNVTFSQTKKAELEVKFVQNRLHEIERIAKEQKPSPERKQKADLALQELKKNTTTIKQRLDSLKAANDQSEVTIALFIKEKTDGYETALKHTKSTLKDGDDQEAKEDLQKALQSVNEVQIGALGVIVDNHKDGKSKLSDEQVKDLVKTELDSAKNAFNDLKGENDKDKTETKAETEVDEQEEAKNNSIDELESTLVLIEELIQLNNLEQAVNKLAESSQKSTQIGLDIKQTTQPTETKNPETTNDTDTMTDDQTQPESEGTETSDEKTETTSKTETTDENS